MQKARKEWIEKRGGILGLEMGSRLSNPPELLCKQTENHSKTHQKKERQSRGKRKFEGRRKAKKKKRGGTVGKE